MTHNHPITQLYVLAVLYYTTNGQKWDYRNYISLEYYEIPCGDGQLYSNLTCGKYGEEEWRLDEGILMSANHCQWAGIRCDEKNRTIAIHLQHIDNVHGSLPQELSALNTSLAVLVTGENYDISTGLWLPWNIPTTFGALRNLNLLDVSNIITGTLARDNVYGTIPFQLGTLPSLMYLDFSANCMVGTIPTFLGQLSQLLTLRGDFNNLVGTIPSELMQLKALRELDFRENLLTGSISDEFCSIISEQLEVFALDCVNAIVCPCCTMCNSGPVPAPVPTFPVSQTPSHSVVPTSAFQWDERQPRLKGVIGGGAYFGSTTSIATSRDRVAIGATGRRPYVEVYGWNGNSWVVLGKILTFSESLSSVDLSDAGDILAVSTHTITDNTITQRNVRVYIYGEDGEDKWTQLGLTLIVESNEDEGNNNEEGNIPRIGKDVTLSYGVSYGTVVSFRTESRVSTAQYKNGIWSTLGSDILVRNRIISSSLDGLVIAMCGYSEEAYIFEHIVGEASWQQRGQIIEHQGQCDSLSLSGNGNVIAIGDQSQEGRVQVYDFQPSTRVWVKNRRDIIGEEGETQHLGSSVSLSADGTILAVAANGHDGVDYSSMPAQPLTDSGTVRVYHYNNGHGRWYPMCCDMDGLSENERSGVVSLSSDGKRLAIGSPQNDNDNGDQSGNCRIFDLLGGIPTR